MNVVFEAPAEQEFDEIVAFLLSRSSAALATFLDDVDVARGLLVKHPHSGQALGPRVRRLLLRRHPYQLIYLVENDLIRIFAVAHLRRRPRYWRDRLRTVPPRFKE